MRKEINAAKKECEDKITAALQELHKQTGLIPAAVEFDAIDVSTVEHKINAEAEVVIINTRVIAST